MKSDKIIIIVLIIIIIILAGVFIVKINTNDSTKKNETDGQKEIEKEMVETSIEIQKEMQDASVRAYEKYKKEEGEKEKEKEIGTNIVIDGKKYNSIEEYSKEREGIN